MRLRWPRSSWNRLPQSTDPLPKRRSSNPRRLLPRSTPESLALLSQTQHRIDFAHAPETPTECVLRRHMNVFTAIGFFPRPSPPNSPLTLPIEIRGWPVQNPISFPFPQRNQERPLVG